MARVLVVDDDEEIRETLQFIFMDQGHEVVVAQDGIEALETLRSATKPFVVVLDLVMPRLDGYDVLATVATDGQLRGLHQFVVITASGDPLEDALSALLAAPVIPKPFDMDVLTAAVAAAEQRLPDQR